MHRRFAVLLLASALTLVAAEREAPRIRVVSWNLGGLSVPETERASVALDRFGDAADVLALQECPRPDRVPRGWHGVFEYTNAILSRWPIVRSGLVPANPAWPRELPWADIQPPSGPAVRIYSVHLTFRRGLTPFLYEARAIEARRVLLHAREFEGPVILAGDFNTVGRVVDGQESEPLVQLIEGSGYASALGESGGRTHLILGRLDWIFSRGLKPVDAKLGSFNGSDHRWLLAEFDP